MTDLIQFLLKYGYVVVFAGALAEQMGLPLPAVPLLVGMGALSRSGEFSLAGVIAAAAAASLLADLFWYQLGRYHGRRVLRLICRISLEPDYCVRRTEDAFERMGLWALPAAKFVPGFNAAAVPLAGMMQTPWLRFLVFDAVGVTLWSTTYAVLGYVFSEQIELTILYLSRVGGSLITAVVVAVAVYVSYKLNQRRKFLKGLTVMRISAEELKARMDAKENILILDTRNRLDRQTDPVRIPGAFHILPEHIDFQPEDIEFRREIVVYCTCPNEATSARVSIQLQRLGLPHARPLQGGLEAWKARKLPVEPLD